MGTKAIGAYIAALREQRGITQQSLADSLGISERGLRGWEKGNTAPDIDDLNALITRLRGSWTHITQLLRDDATPEQARTLAQRQAMGSVLSDEQRSFIENLDPDQLAALITVAAERIAQR